MELEIIKEQGFQSAKIKNIEQDIKEIQAKLDKVLTFVDETRGGQKILWALLSLASTLGGVVGYFASKWM